MPSGRELLIFHKKIVGAQQNFPKTKAFQLQFFLLLEENIPTRRRFSDNFFGSTKFKGGGSNRHS